MPGSRSLPSPAPGDVPIKPTTKSNPSANTSFMSAPMLPVPVALPLLSPPRPFLQTVLPIAPSANDLLPRGNLPGITPTTDLRLKINEETSDSETSGKRIDGNGISDITKRTDNLFLQQQETHRQKHPRSRQRINLVADEDSASLSSRAKLTLTKEGLPWTEKVGENEGVVKGVVIQERKSVLRSAKEKTDDKEGNGRSGRRRRITFERISSAASPPPSRENTSQTSNQSRSIPVRKKTTANTTSVMESTGGMTRQTLLVPSPTMTIGKMPKPTTAATISAQSVPLPDHIGFTFSPESSFISGGTDDGGSGGNVYRHHHSSKLLPKSIATVRSPPMELHQQNSRQAQHQRHQHHYHYRDVEPQPKQNLATTVLPLSSEDDNDYVDDPGFTNFPGSFYHHKAKRKVVENMKGNKIKNSNRSNINRKWNVNNNMIVQAFNSTHHSLLSLDQKPPKRLRRKARRSHKRMLASQHPNQ